MHPVLSSRPISLSWLPLVYRLVSAQTWVILLLVLVLVRHLRA